MRFSHRSEGQSSLLGKLKEIILWSMLFHWKVENKRVQSLQLHKVILNHVTPLKYFIQIFGDEGVTKLVATIASGSLF